MRLEVKLFIVFFIVLSFSLVADIIIPDKKTYTDDIREAGLLYEQ